MEMIEHVKDNAVVDFEELLLSGRSIREALAIIEIRFSLDEETVLAHFEKMNQKPIEQWLDESKSSLIDLTKGQDTIFEQVKRNIQKQINKQSSMDFSDHFQSIFDVANPKNLPFKIRQTGDEHVDYSNRLELAQAWFQNVLDSANVNPIQVLIEVSSEFDVDKEDLKLLFEEKTNQEYQDYHESVWGGLNRIIKGNEPTVINEGNGRTKYVRPDSTSTSYFNSRYKIQNDAWEKLERMVLEASLSAGADVEAS